MSISKLITNGFKDKSGKSALKIKAKFMSSTFGVLIHGIALKKPGVKYSVKESDGLTMSFVSDPDGKLMIKACADPDTFAKNYPSPFTALMTGKEIIGMAERVPEAQGILVCSATSFNSFPIYKEDYEQIRSFPVRRWWELWKL